MAEIYGLEMGAETKLTGMISRFAVAKLGSSSAGLVTGGVCEDSGWHTQKRLLSNFSIVKTPIP